MGGMLVKTPLLPKYHEHMLTCSPGYASDPVMVSGSHTGRFGFSSVPKTACTNWRALLRALVLHPEMPPRDVDKDNWDKTVKQSSVHLSRYSSIWQYDLVGLRASDDLPLFKVARHP